MIEKIIKTLKLKPHIEGGFFKETYRSDEIIPGKILPNRYGSDRCCGTAIYYMITADSFSHMHRIKSDEIFHFYVGDPAEMLLLFPDGTGRTITLGSGITEGMEPQVIVPKGVWQGMKLRDGGDYALLGTTVAPGFDYNDFEKGSREKLAGEYPAFRARITGLTDTREPL